MWRQKRRISLFFCVAVLQYIPSPPSGPTNYAKFFRKSCLDTPVSFFFCRWVWQGISRKILVLISHLTLPLPRSYPKEICVEHTLLTNKGVTLGNVIVKSWVLPINIRWEPKRKKNHPCQDSKKRLKEYSLDTIQDFFSNFCIKWQLNWVKNYTFP